MKPPRRFIFSLIVLCILMAGAVFGAWDVGPDDQWSPRRWAKIAGYSVGTFLFVAALCVAMGLRLPVRLHGPNRVRLITGRTMLGPAWLHLDAPKPLKRRRHVQDVELVFLQPLASDTVEDGWGPVGPSGRGVLLEVELCDPQGQWHTVSSHGYLRGGGEECLFYRTYRDESPGPFVAVRLRAAEPVTLLRASWHCSTLR